MFHKAIDLKFLDGTSLEVCFQDGVVKRYDMRVLFSKYPQLKQLEDRALFLSGNLMGAYGIVWSDDLDIETETIYEDGETVRHETLIIHQESAHAVSAARAIAGISQKRLAELVLISPTFLKLRGVSRTPLLRHLTELQKHWVGSFQFLL